jgi:hypothetical protein
MLADYTHEGQGAKNRSNQIFPLRHNCRFMIGLSVMLSQRAIDIMPKRVENECDTCPNDRRQKSCWLAVNDLFEEP